MVSVQVANKTRNLSLPDLRAHPALADLTILKKGNRLSITPVDAAHWQVISKLLLIE